MIQIWTSISSWFSFCPFVLLLHTFYQPSQPPLKGQICINISIEPTQPHLSQQPRGQTGQETSTSAANSGEILLSTHTIKIQTIEGSPWLHIMMFLSSKALLEAQNLGICWDVHGAASTPNQPMGFKPWEGSTTHERTHTHNVQNIYSEQVCSHSILSHFSALSP